MSASPSSLPRPPMRCPFCTTPSAKNRPHCEEHFKHGRDQWLQHCAELVCNNCSAHYTPSRAYVVVGGQVQWALLDENGSPRATP